MRIDPYSDRPKYRQLADILRRQIQAGQPPPGERLPSIPSLQQEYELGRDAVRQALAVLRAEGLIVTLHGLGSVVRDRVSTRRVRLQPGDEVGARMPTPQERREFGLPEGVPVLVVERPGEAARVHASDRTTLVAPGGGG